MKKIYQQTVGEVLDRVKSRESGLTDEEVKRSREACGWNELTEGKKKSIPQIFSQQGEQAFRQMEQQVARGLGRRKNAVISTGGGFLMREETVRALRESAEGSAVVFLDCSFETCYERIRSSDRPLVRANTREQLYEIFLNRQQRYREVADLVIQNEQLVSQTVEEIVRQLAI